MKAKPARVSGTHRCCSSITGHHTPASYHTTEGGPPHSDVLSLQSTAMPSHACPPTLLLKSPLIHTWGLISLSSILELWASLKAAFDSAPLARLASFWLTALTALVARWSGAFTLPRATALSRCTREAPAVTSSFHFSLWVAWTFFSCCCLGFFLATESSNLFKPPMVESGMCSTSSAPWRNRRVECGFLCELGRNLSSVITIFEYLGKSQQNCAKQKKS